MLLNFVCVSTLDINKTLFTFCVFIIESYHGNLYSDAVCSLALESSVGESHSEWIGTETSQVSYLGDKGGDYSLYCYLSFKWVFMTWES